MLLNKEIYKRFTTGKYTRNDYLSVKEAFFNEKDQKKLDIFMEEDWTNINQSNLDKEKRLEHLLYKIHFIINKNEAKKSISQIRKIWNVYLRIAAILLVPILIAGSYYFFNSNNINKLQSPNSYTEIYAPLGSRTRFQLPDGSTGWLNSGSILKYSQPFTKNRKVELAGEAYFDVKHINESTFKVAFSGIIVNVLGTSFNIVSYDDEKAVEVILEKGQVEIVDKQNQIISKLVPNQKFTLNKSLKSAIIENVNAANYTAWRNGKLIFRNEPLPEVIKRLERWYNADFIIADDQLNNIRYRATFSDEPLDEILRLLSLSSPIHYEIQKREVNENNEFQKKRIVLTTK